MKLSASRITMQQGKKKTIKLKNYTKLSKSKIKKVKWTSSNKKVVTVTASGKYKQNGILKGKKKGTATVKVKYNGKTYKCKVTVSLPKAKTTEESEPEEDTDETDSKKDTTVYLKGITIQGDFLQKTVEGTSLQLTAVLYPDNVTDKSVTWFSTDESVATVDMNGKVTAASPGYAYIYVKHNKSGLQSFIRLQVNNTLKYSYEVFFLGTFYDHGYYVNGHYGNSWGGVYIRTDNPNPDSIYFEGGYANGGDDYYDIDYLTEEDKGSRLRRVEGGYFANFAAGHKVTLKECALDENGEPIDVDNIYAAGPSYEVEIHNFDKEYDAWMDQVIEEVTTPDMNKHEKMCAITRYFLLHFYYIPRAKTLPKGPYDYELVGCFSKIGPSFRSYISDSYQGPRMLRDFGKKIGYEVYDPHDVEGEVLGKGVSIHHGMVCAKFEGQVYYYVACPNDGWTYVEWYEGQTEFAPDEEILVDLEKYYPVHYLRLDERPLGTLWADDLPKIDFSQYGK